MQSKNNPAAEQANKVGKTQGWAVSAIPVAAARKVDNEEPPSNKPQKDVEPGAQPKPHAVWRRVSHILEEDLKELDVKLKDNEKVVKEKWDKHQKQQMLEQKDDPTNRYKVEMKEKAALEYKAKREANQGAHKKQLEQRPTGRAPSDRAYSTDIHNFVGEDDDDAGKRLHKVRSNSKSPTPPESQPAGNANPRDTSSVETGRKYVVSKAPVGSSSAPQRDELSTPDRNRNLSLSMYRKLSAVEMSKAAEQFREVLDALPDMEHELGVNSATHGSSEDAQLVSTIFRIFKCFAKGGEGASETKHANSMDLNEFMQCLESMKIVPVCLSKRTATTLFKEANAMNGSDYDSHEMSQFEFLRALEIMAKRVGFSELAELVFTREQRLNMEHNEADAARNRRDEEHDSMALADVQSLGNLRLEHMRAFLKLFKTLTVETATEPQLPMDVFVQAFQPVLKLPESEIAMLFMKIDVNSDGIVTWNEFSSFILDMHTKGGTLAQGDTVFDGTRLEDKDLDSHHEDSITFTRYMHQHGLLVSMGQDGVVKTWQGSTGVAHSKAPSKTVRATPASTSVMSFSVLVRSSMLAVGSDDFKIRFYDAATLRQELTYDTSGRWPMSMAVFEFPEDNKEEGEAKDTTSAGYERDKREMAAWFCWGDNTGEVHFIPEAQLLALRTHLEVVPVFKSSIKGTWEVRVFAPPDNSTQVWCTQLSFVQDVGVNGVVVVACSTGAIGVVSIEGRDVLHYFHQHRLSVKALEWCSRQNNLMASAGLDRDIHLWRPVPIKHGKPIYTGSLTGHKARVTALAFHEARDVLFSLDSHSIILVWDLASRTLICRLLPLSNNPFDINHKVIDIIVNPVTRHLVTSTNHPRLWGVRSLDLRDESDRLFAHTAPVVACLYNTHFDHMLTVDSAGFVSLWQIATGRQLFKFMAEEVEATNKAPTVTCAAFDESERRLLVGWSQGSVQTYNFSNGTLLNNLIGETTASVTALTHATYAKGRGDCRHLVLAAYDDGTVLQWPSKMLQKDVAPTRRMETPPWMGADLIDVPVTDMAFTKPTTLMVARGDGLVMLWDMQTGFLMKNDKGSMAMHVTDNTSVAIRCIKFMHKMPHVCVVADEAGSVHLVDTVRCEKAATFQPEDFGGPKKTGGVGADGISALEVDDTDSFLLAGDCNGLIKVWDISQIFADVVLDVSLCIDLFKWKAHKEEVTHVTHIARHNLIMTSSRENKYQAMLWTVTGVKIGVLGHLRWTPEHLAAKTGNKTVHTGSKPATGDKAGTPSAFRARLNSIGAHGLSEGSDQKKLYKLGLMRNAANVFAEGIQERQLSKMEQQVQDDESEVEDNKDEEGSDARGQLTVTVLRVMQLPNVDKVSKVDPYCVIKLVGHAERRTRMIENLSDAAINEQFLYFVHNLTGMLTIEVWDYDPGGEQLHDFIGQIAGTLEYFLAGRSSVTLSLPLGNKDGSTPGNLGIIEVKLEFEAVTSELDQDSKPHTLQETIRHVLGRHKHDSVVYNLAGQYQILRPADVVSTPGGRLDGESCFVPVEVKDAAAPVGFGEMGSVTSLATARWGTADFRNLAVYRLQDDRVMSQHISGAQTERLDRRRKKQVDPEQLQSLQTARPSRVGAEHRYAKDTCAGRLERTLESFFTAEGSPSGSEIMMTTAKYVKSSGQRVVARATSASSATGSTVNMPPLPLHRLSALGAGKQGVVRVMHVPRKQQEEQRLAEDSIRRARQLSSTIYKDSLGDDAGERSQAMVGGMPVLRRHAAESQSSSRKSSRR